MKGIHGRAATAADGPVIEVAGLEKSYGRTRALSGVDLSVSRGEMFALVGPDGAGKTTMIRTLCGILRADRGGARVLGLDIEADRARIKRRIGYLSQRFSLYADLSIDENIEFFAEINGLADYAARRDELLSFTRLEPFRSRLAGRLSGGMKQKLALACTLIHKPEILFLDEPTTGVDPVSRREFWMILTDLLSGGMTVFTATPYLDEAERCGRVGLLHQGRFLMVDTPSAVKKAMAGSVLEVVCPRIRDAAALLRQSPVFIDVQMFGDRLNLVAADPIAAERIAGSLLAGAGIPVRSFRSVSPSLENVFISLLTSR